SGTTALWEYLNEHPQVYLCTPKHTRFFASEGKVPDFGGPKPPGLGAKSTRRAPYAITDIEEYRRLFDGAAGRAAIGEASHSYLYTPGTPERVRYYAPDAKLIAILRDPVKRAYSHFCFMVQNGREPLDDFARAVEEEEAGRRDDWWPTFQYVRVGFYYAQLRPYFDLFERDQIRVYLQEDLHSDPLSVVQDVFRFLNIDDSYVPDVTKKHNGSGIPKNKMLETLLGRPNPLKSILKETLPEKQRAHISARFARMRSRNLARPPQLPAELRARLVEKYREDILNLQGLIQRDLSSWLV
ncbi:MAG TPA: sulfotransferase, partial [Rubrobacteraceae bacterium]|nr:sulfotransferase [Rubrobacteraceae bacterium]